MSAQLQFPFLVSAPLYFLKIYASFHQQIILNRDIPNNCLWLEQTIESSCRQDNWNCQPWWQFGFCSCCFLSVKALCCSNIHVCVMTSNSWGYTITSSQGNITKRAKEHGRFGGVCCHRSGLRCLHLGICFPTISWCSRDVVMLLYDYVRYFNVLIGLHKW